MWGGGVDGGLLFHFILSKIVSPASRRHWSLMYDGKLMKQDTSLKNQTKTIKNLHGWLWIFFLAQWILNIYIVNPLPCLVSHLLIEKRNNFVMPCLHIIPLRPKKKIQQHGYIKLIHYINFVWFAHKHFLSGFMMTPVLLFLNICCHFIVW